MGYRQLLVSVVAYQVGRLAVEPLVDGMMKFRNVLSRKRLNLWGRFVTI